MDGSRSATVETVEHGALSLGFLPAVGGRLLSLRYGDRELLFRGAGPWTAGADGTLTIDREQLPPETDMTTWWNLGGSKTWPAPQDEWGGPPDPVLDGGPYSFAATREDGTTRVVMISAPDPRTGLEITREFLIGPRAGGFDQLIRLRNVVRRPITWAPWEVCQVDTSAAGATSVHVDVGASDVVDLGRYVGAPAVSASDHGVDIPVVAAVAKWGFTGTPTAISIMGPDLTLSLGFTVDPSGTYPDGGCTAELWMQHPTAEPVAVLDGWQPDAWLVELEVLGPLVTLAPGESTELAITWDVTES